MTNPKFAQTSESGRTYPIPGYENKTLYSVTTALNAISKPALMPWAAKLVAERAMEMIETGIFDQTVLTAKARKEFLTKMKAAPTEYTKKAQVRGSAVHKACETPYKGTVDEEIASYVLAYIDFLEIEGFRLVEQELTVFNPNIGENYGYAGTLDAIVEKDGKFYVMDIKTGGVYPSASLQMAAYAHAPLKIDDSGVASAQSLPIAGAFVLELKPRKYTIHWVDISIAQYELFLKVLDVSIWNNETSRSVIGDTHGPVT